MAENRDAMGFLDKLRKTLTSPSSSTHEAQTLHAAGTVHVVGESYRQDVLAQVAASATAAAPFLGELKGKARAIAVKDPKRRWFRAALFREPNNPHDPNAVAVHASGHGLVGYLDREAAIDYRPVFEELRRQGVTIGSCPAMLTGGDGGSSWGVILCLSSPEAVLGDLRA